MKILSGISFVATKNFFLQGVNLIVFVVLARFLTPSEIGVVSLGLAFVSFLQIFQDQGFQQAVVHSRATSTTYLSTAFWTNIFVSSILMVVIVVISEKIAALFNEPNLRAVLISLAPLLLIRSMMSIQVALLQRKLDFKSITLAAVLGSSVGGVLGITSAYLGFGIWSLVIYQITFQTIEVCIIWSRSEWLPKLVFRFSEWSKLFAYGSSVTASQLINFGNRYGAELILGIFLGSTAVGLYSVAFKLVRTTVTITGAVVSSVMFPAFSSLQSNRAEGRKLYCSCTFFLSIITFPMFAGMAILADDLITIIFGLQWLGATPVFQILCAVGLLHSVFYPNNAVLLGYGKPVWQLGIDLFNSTTNLVLFYLVVKFGIIAVSLTYVVRAYIYSPIQIWPVCKLLSLNVSEYLKIFRPAAFSTLVMTIVLALVKEIGILSDYLLLNLFFQILLSICLYFLTLQLAFKDEFKKIKSVLHSVFKGLERHKNE